MATSEEIKRRQLQSIYQNRDRHQAAASSGGQPSGYSPSYPPYRPSSGGQQRPQGQQGGQQSVSALPPKKPEAAPSTFMPLIDPNRVKAGDKSKTGLAQTKLFDVNAGILAGLKLTGKDKLLGLKEGDTVELGDIFPNMQEALKPIFNPPSKEETVAKQAEAQGSFEEWKKAQTGKPYVMPTLEGIAQAIGGGMSLQDVAGNIGSQLQGTLLGAQKVSADITKWGAEKGGVAAALAGAPQAVMNLANTGAQMTEQTIGTATQSAGVAGVNPAQMIMGGQTIPTLAKIGSALANAVGATDLAAELDKHTSAPPSIVANLVANVVARQRAAGQDSSMAEGILNTVMGTLGADLSGHPNTMTSEQLIDMQGQALQSAQGMSPEAWKASMFTYEGPQYVQEATQRLNAGEDWDTVYADIETKITPEARINDFVGQMVLDPLNALDMMGGVGKVMGMGTRSERNAANAMRELVMQTDEGVGLLRLAETGGDVSQVGALERKLRRVPVLGELLRPLPETIVNRRGEEASAVIKMIGQGISPEAPQRLLAEGIDQHPLALAMESFINHNADDIAGTGKSASEIQEMLGLGGRAMTNTEAATLGAPPGAMADMFRSNAADRTRDWLAKAGDNAQKLADEFVDMQKFYSETLTSGVAKTVGAAGEEILVKGDDAITLAENKLIQWLEGVNTTFMKASGVKEPTGLYKNLLDTRKFFGKVQTPFRFFHMSTNPGMAIRNLGTNKMLGWLDNFNMLTPVRSTQAEIGRLGLSGAGLARQLGAQTDITKGMREIEKGGVKGMLHKVDPMRWSQHFEDISGQQITLQAFQRHMGSNWRVGKAIPEDKWAEVATYFGDRADEARSLLEGAWAPGEPQKVIERLMTDDAWKSAAKTSLNGTHDVDLMNDLDEIVQAAPNQQAAEDLIEQYSQVGRGRFEQFLDRGMVMEGTPAALAMDAAQMAVKGLPPKKAGKMLDDFTKEIVRRDATVYLNRSYTKQALEQLQKIDPARIAEAGFAPPPELGNQSYWGWLQKRMSEVEEISTTAMEEYRPIQYQVFDAIDKGNWAKMQELGQQIAAKSPDGFNPFAAVNNRGSAWDAYFQYADEYWSEYSKSRVGEMQGIYDDAASAIQKVTGMAPPAAPSDLLEKFLPLTTAEQRRLFAQIQAIGRSRGLERVADIRDVLEKAGIEHAGRLFRADIVDRNWYERAVVAIMLHEQEGGLAGKLAGEAIDDSKEISVLMQKLGIDPADLDPQALNMTEGMAAQMSERDAQIQKVLDAVRNTPPSSTMDPEAIERLREFVKDIEPRHTTTRAIGEQVATKSRDFALLNYGDKRGIDLMAGMFYNYPKWYMGTMKNMVSRALENPGRLAALLKFRQQLRTINRDLPEWWQDQISLQGPAGAMYFNILASFDPLNGFLGDKYRNVDLYNDPLSATMAEGQQYGPGLHGVWATFMAIRALAQGDREASMGWIGNLGPATRGLTAITALAKEYIPGMDFLPSGGVVAEPWLWGSGNLPGQGGAQMIGTPNDAKRIGMSLATLVDMGLAGDPNGITAEQAYEAMLSQRGEIFDRALQMSKVKTSGQVILSWLAGAGYKARDATEIEIQRMDTDRIALMKAKDDGFYDGRPEAWRQAWEEMRENYPWMDFVQGFRRDEVGRANIYSMSVYDRMPPNPRPYITALMGGDTEIYNELLDKFYGGEPGQKPCSIENLSEPEQEMFMSMMKLMGATLALPGDAVAGEWNMARQARAAMYDGLNRQYADIQNIQTQYYDILNRAENRDTAGADAEKFLQQHGELQSYWDDKDQAIARDPLLAKYWGSMELFERVSQDEFERKMATTYPGVHEQIDEYYSLRDTDPSQAKQYLKEHSAITDYWNARTKWTLGLDEELMQMAGGINNLQGEWGKLRQDNPSPNAGQQRVQDLIESGSRPMGDFELPEDMEATQVQAGIQDAFNEFKASGAPIGNLYRQLKAMGGLDKTLTAFQQFASGRAGIETVMSNMAEAKALLAAMASINEGAVTVGSAGGYGGGGGGGGSGNGRTAEVDNALKYLAAVASDGDYMNDWLTHASSNIARAMQQFGQMAAGNPVALDAANKYLQAIAEDGDYMNDWLTHVPPQMQSSLQKLGKLIAESKGSRMARLIRSRNYGGARPPKENKAQQKQADQQFDGFMASLQQEAPRHYGMLQNLATMSQSDIASFLEANPDFRSYLAQLVAQGVTLNMLLSYFRRMNLARAAVSPKAARKR